MVIVFCLFSFEMVAHVFSASLKLAMQLNMTLNFWYSPLHLHSARVTDVCPRIWFCDPGKHGLVHAKQAFSQSCYLPSPLLLLKHDRVETFHLTVACKSFYIDIFIYIWRNWDLKKADRIPGRYQIGYQGVLIMRLKSHGIGISGCYNLDVKDNL